MIVIDASVIIEALIGATPAPELLTLVTTRTLMAPHLLDAEVLSALRGLERRRTLDPGEAKDTQETYFALTIQRYDIAPLAERIWSLRHNVSAYDASNIALAEAIGAPLLTCDARLSSVDTPAQLIIPGAGADRAR